jgi:hypothetical protein
MTNFINCNYPSNIINGDQIKVNGRAKQDQRPHGENDKDLQTVIRFEASNPLEVLKCSWAISHVSMDRVFGGRL